MLKIRLPIAATTAVMAASWVPFDVPVAALTGGSIQWTPDLADDDVRGFWATR